MVKIFLPLFVLSSLFATVSPAPAADPEMKFEFYKDRAGDYRWRLKGPDGSVLAVSAIGHKQSADAKAGLETLRKSGTAGDLKFDTFLDESNRHRWRLIAESGETVAVSNGGYKAVADADRAIATLKLGAGKATVAVLK